MSIENEITTIRNELLAGFDFVRVVEIMCELGMEWESIGRVPTAGELLAKAGSMIDDVLNNERIIVSRYRCLMVEKTATRRVHLSFVLTSVSYEDPDSEYLQGMLKEMLN